MMIMDQRVLFNSAVRCSGNVLLLQGKKYSPPFTISAIGPVETMKKALDNSQEVTIYRQYVSAFGLGWQVDEKEKTPFRRDRRIATAAAIRAGDEQRNRRIAANGRNAGIARGEVTDEARGTKTASQKRGLDDTWHPRRTHADRGGRLRALHRMANVVDGRAGRTQPNRNTPIRIMVRPRPIRQRHHCASAGRRPANATAKRTGRRAHRSGLHSAIRQPMAAQPR